MINKTRYISISLLILSILVAIVGAVIIQDDITLIVSSSTLAELEDQTTFTAIKIIVLLISQCVICAFLHSLTKNVKSSKKVEDFETESETIELKKEKLSVQKETENLQTILETTLSSIDALNIDKLGKKVFGEQLLSELADKFRITQGILYEIDSEESKLCLLSSYAYYKKDSNTLEFGEGLAGQVAKAKRIVNIQSIPSGYIKTVSGLGESTPTNLLICPLLVEGETIGILELASFEEFSKETEHQFSLITQNISKKLNSV